MYYPKQIPYLLNTEFNKVLSYSEDIIEEISEFCMCIWTMKSKIKSQKTIINNILPDACIDIIIDFTTNTIFVAGFSKDTQIYKLNKKIDYMG